MVPVKESNTTNIKYLTWKEVSHKVTHANPELAAIINHINPDSTYKVILAQYPYGSSIIKNNNFCLPADLNDIKQLSPSIHEFLEYTDIPMGLILNNSAELFTSLNNKIIPFVFYKKGKIFGIYENLTSLHTHHRLQIFNMTAGGRSVFMLPKITDFYSHKKLQTALKIHHNTPKSMNDHWSIFVEISNNDSKAKQWHTEILFFSHQWMKKIKCDSAWSELHAFLLQEAYNNSVFWQDQMHLNLLFNQFIMYTENKNIKIFPHYLEILKQLMAISLGLLPAFVPAINEIAGPFEFIQNAYLHYYELKEYIPTIMHLNYFCPTQKNSIVYYSLNWPTLLKSLPKPKTPVNVITELEETQKLASHFFEFLSENNINLEKITFSLLKNIEFQFFHNNQSYSKQIFSSTKMPEQDPNLLKLFGNYPLFKKNFCDASQFVRGCVAISCKGHKK